MQAHSLQNILTHLRKLTDPQRPRELSDQELLDRFVRQREEAAFTLLVQRHGPMVFGVCRRILRDTHAAEDALQVTFLTLVRYAHSIRKKQSLASWLHSVAARICYKTRMRTVRQRQVEREVFPRRLPLDPLENLATQQLRETLDNEINRLPDKYRVPLVLCYLSEKTHEEAARELGWPKSSVTARLARARELLQRRLMQRGFTVSAGLLTTVMMDQSANATLPTLAILTTVRRAAEVINRPPLFEATVALANTVLKGNALAKWIMVCVLLGTLGLTALIGKPLASVRPEAKVEETPTQQTAARVPIPKTETRRERVDRFGDPLPEGALARMGSGRLRHGGFARALTFSPDGQMLVSSGFHALRGWDPVTGKLLRRFDTAQLNRLSSIRFTSDGIAVADVIIDKASNEGIPVFLVYDPATGKMRRRLRLRATATIYNPTLSPDGTRIALAQNNTICLYDTKTGELTSRIAGEGMAVWEIAFAPDGKTLAFTNLTDTISIYRTTDGQRIRQLQRKGEVATHLLYSPNGRYLVSLPNNRPTRNGEVSIWDVNAGKELYHWTHPFPMAVAAAFSPDSKLVALDGGRWGVVIREIESGKELRRLSPHGGVYALAFSPDGKSLATASPQGAIRLWNTETGKLLPSSADAEMQYCEQLRFSADGKQLLGCAGSVVFWDTADGRETRRLADPAALGLEFPNDMRHLVLSPDETLLAAANPNGTIGVWDAVTGKEKLVLKGHKRYIWDLTFSPDGRRVISSGSDEAIRVWDVENGRELQKFRGRSPMVVSADNHWLATADEQSPKVFVYELDTGKEVKHFELASTGSVFRLAFAPDDRTLAAAGYSGPGSNSSLVSIWDVIDGKTIRSLSGHKEMVWSLAFSPDGRTLALGDDGGGLQLRELASGRIRHTFTGHVGAIYALRFSPDGRTLAASSADAPVYVWDVATKHKRRSLTNDELQRDWRSLAGEDAETAFRAIRDLRDAPDQSVPFLREHLQPVSKVDVKRVRQLVEALDDSDFATRQKVREELEKQADAGVSILRQIVEKEKPSLEVRRTLQQILQAQETAPEALRAVRAVEVLEWIATPEALRLLSELANGAPDARLTREATAAVKRLKHKKE